MGAFFRRRFEDKFLVLWCLQGSSMHKCYPFGQDVALEFLQRHRDAMTITVGDDLCRLIEWDHERNQAPPGAVPHPDRGCHGRLFPPALRG